jgi:hypothetical protein
MLAVVCSALTTVLTISIFWSSLQPPAGEQQQPAGGAGPWSPKMLSPKHRMLFTANKKIFYYSIYLFIIFI